MSCAKSPRRLDFCTLRGLMCLPFQKARLTRRTAACFAWLLRRAATVVRMHAPAGPPCWAGIVELSVTRPPALGADRESSTPSAWSERHRQILFCGSSGTRGHRLGRAYEESFERRLRRHHPQRRSRSKGSPGVSLSMSDRSQRTFTVMDTGISEPRSGQAFRSPPFDWTRPLWITWSRRLSTACVRVDEGVLSWRCLRILELAQNEFNGLIAIFPSSCDRKSSQISPTRTSHTAVDLD